MNYGDPANPPSGRAQVPGSAGGRDDRGGTRPTGDDSGGLGDGLSLGGVPASGGSAGRATVGRASVGRASAGPDEPMTGRASVPVPGTSATTGSTTAGRATVGRATVRSGAEGLVDDRPGGPGFKGPAGPKGRSAGAKSTGARAKKRRRRNFLIVSIAAFIMLAGIGMVSGTYYFDKVALPQDIPLTESTTIYYSDGKTQIARIGEQTRTLVTIEDIPDHVENAVIAAEDNSFRTNDGVDYRGVARAAWNNVTGGELQGASTISQQYARHWAELEGVTYGRKVREAVIALKLNQQYDKNQIMAMYLNVVYFGRGAYGIEAAAQAYFAKSVKELTVAEGMVLAGIIKNPEGTGKGSPFDPTVNKAEAEGRFNNYLKPTMVKLNFLTQAEADAMQYPTTVKPLSEVRSRIGATVGMEKPEGLIVHHVLGEVSRLKGPDGKLKYQGVDEDGKPSFKPTILNGGLKIVTTIDHRVQAAAVAEASRAKGSNMEGQPENLQAALVAVQPGTGRVLAYYGGDNGTGNDYAGYYQDPVLSDGEESCCGGHPPGSTFKVYTLAAALIDGYTIDSHWDGTSPQDFPASGRTGKNAIRNAGEGTNPDCAAGGKYCTLEEATHRSLNTPFFAVGEKVGSHKVVDVARAAGVKRMWATVNGQPKPVNVELEKVKGTASKQYFSTEVAFGQYPTTVLDHANGIASFAAGGLAANVHFLQEVYKKETKVDGETIAAKRIPGFTEAMAKDLNHVLTGVPKRNRHQMSDGRPVAGKTGTWQLRDTRENAHAWMVGYTATAKNSPGLAAAVWVGNRADEKAIKTKSGTNIGGSTLPGPVWRDFMQTALKAMNQPKVSFAPKVGVGSKDVGTGVSPTAPQPPDPNNPNPNPDPSNGRPGGNNGPGGGNGGNGGGQTTFPFPRPSITRNND